MKKLFLLLLFGLSVSALSHAQALSSLDSSFAAYGIYTGDTGSVVKMAVQPDGKIIIVDGERKYGKQTMAMRFNGDGSIDSSFAEYGRFFQPADLEGASIVSVCLQPDGEIIIAGTVDTGITHSDFLLLRLKNDGTPDSSFGGVGYVVTSYNEASDTLAAIALQPDGKILAYGYFNDGQDTLQVMRYHTDGSPDSSFGLYGRVKLYEGFTDAVPNNITVMPDGRIVAGGEASINALNGASAFTAIRLLPDGSLDTSFNHTGIAYTDIDLNLNLPGLLPPYYDCKVMSVQADGKILFAGHVYLYTPSMSLAYDTAIIVRLDTLGQPDSSFGGKGFVGLLFRAQKLADMVVQPDGKIIFGTNSPPFSFPVSISYYIFRIMPDGGTDSSLYFGGYWGIMAWSVSNWTASGCSMETMTLQPDGKLLVGGHYLSQSYPLYMARHIATAATSAAAPALQQNDDITVYPNPTADYLYIYPSVPQTIRQLSLYSSDGKLLLTKTYPYIDRLATDGLADGIYYLKLNLGNHQQVTKKVIIQKN